MPLVFSRKLFHALCAALLSLCFFTSALADNSDTAADTEELPGRAVLHTSEGAITFKLFGERSPVTVANFVQYARDGFYDGTIFHRVVPRFVIQGGGFTPELMQKTTREPIVNEARTSGLNNDRWTVAMARTSDPDSATSQFFVNLRGNSSLNPLGERDGYAVFARVTEGRGLLRNISKVPTEAVGPHPNVPVRPVVIKSIELLP